MVVLTGLTKKYHFPIKNLLDTDPLKQKGAWKYRLTKVQMGQFTKQLPEDQLDPKYMGVTALGESGYDFLPAEGDKSTWSKPQESQDPTPLPPPTPDSTGEDPRASVRESNGILSKGTITGMKPMNIPDIAVNPFQLAGFAEGGLQTSYEQGLPGSGDVEVGAKNTENTPTPAQIGENGQQIAPENADPQLNGANPSAEVPIDWMNRQPSLETARRRAFLDAPRGSGPMKIRERMNEAMGMQDEKDGEGRLTGRTFINNAEGQATLFDDSVEGSKMARNNYLDDPQAFLKGVMAGDVVLGGKNGTELEEQSEGTLDATETPTDIKPESMAIGDIRIPNDQYGSIMGSLGDTYPQLKGYGVETDFDPDTNSWKILATTDKEGKVVNY